MAGPAARTTIDPSDGRRGQCRRRGRTARSPEQDASDRLAPERYARRPAARQRPRPDAEIDGAAGSWRLAPRQAQGEHRTFARLARHGHVAAPHARELARECKAQPRAAEALSGRGIGLGELLEQLRLLLRGLAEVLIRDRKLDPVSAVRPSGRYFYDPAGAPREPLFAA